MGPWTRALVAALAVGDDRGGDGEVTELHVEPSLVTALVDGRRVAFSAAPISPGIWTAIAGSVPSGVQSEQFAQLLQHTWDEPLVPAQIVRLGEPGDIAAVARELAAEVEREPAVLLRWRGFGTDDSDGSDPWRGSELPDLPPPARRPPESVPKRFGASGIHTPDGDLVEVLVRAYRAFAE